MANVEHSIVGELINFRGMLYAPLNENGVFLLFGKVAEDLNMYVEEIRPEAPDAIVRRFVGKGWERLRVEFEYRSSDYRRQGENSDHCDALVCWEHDWTDCPYEVIELRDRIREMENYPIHRPDEPADGAEVKDLDEWFAAYRVPDRTRALFAALAEHVQTIDETCFYRVGKGVISFYSPQRAFLHAYPQQNMLNLALFLGDEPLGDAEPMERRGPGRQWGSLSVADQDRLLEVLSWVEESHKRMVGATRRNERTTWRGNPAVKAAEVAAVEA
jgi:hypothetical protein